MIKNRLRWPVAALALLLLLAACRPAALTPTAAPAFAASTAGQTPEQVTQAFYDAYLQLARAQSPLAGGSYRSLPGIDGEFARRVEQGLAAMQQGGFDPFLCAQDVPEEITAGQATVNGDEAVVPVSTSFQGHHFQARLHKVLGEWRITGIQCSEGALLGQAKATTSPTQAPAAVEGWHVYRNEEYGFQLRYPAGWVYQQEMNEPGKPPIGPENMKLIVLFMPQAWADAQASQSAPDPNKPGIAPFTLEVTIGSLEAYRDSFPGALSEKPVTLHGLPASLEEHAAGETARIYRIMVPNPHAESERITFTDPVSGFPERAQGNEAVIEQFQAMLNTLEFFP